jgi:hypothetical protein
MSNKETMYRTTRYVWYIFSVIEVILLLRFGLKLLAANPGAGFTQLVYAVSGVFIAPFQYVFGAPSAGGSTVEFSTLLALFVYWVIAWGIVKLIVMNRPVDSYEAERSLENQDNA